MPPRTTISAFLACLLTSALVALAPPAGAALDSSRFVGTWSAIAVQTEGRVLEIKDDDGVLVTFGPAPGRTFKLAMALGPLRRVLKGTWRVERDTLIMVDAESGDESRAAVETRGPLLVLHAESGMTLVLQRGPDG